ncbi:hypothetical protein ACQWG0_24995, partial [Salmonella enterica subsp. enterica serovar Infantis]
ADITSPVTPKNKVKIYPKSPKTYTKNTLPPLPTTKPNTFTSTPNAKLKKKLNAANANSVCAVFKREKNKPN